jgi:hypothetical protein
MVLGEVVVLHVVEEQCTEQNIEMIVTLHHIVVTVQIVHHVIHKVVAVVHTHHVVLGEAVVLHVKEDNIVHVTIILIIMGSHVEVLQILQVVVEHVQHRHHQRQHHHLHQKRVRYLVEEVFMQHIQMEAL